jgi:nucleotide-binding universal stress UspA family protein
VYKHKRVLVALDGSPSSDAVLAFLLDIAGPLGLSVHLLRVLEIRPPMAIEGMTTFTYDEETRWKDAAAYLSPLAARLRAQGVEATCEVRRGRPAAEILAAARESKVDLIAMATPGRTGLGRLLFGSVAEEVLRQAPVPVFIIRQPAPADAVASTGEGRGAPAPR